MDAYTGEIRMFGGNFAPVNWAFCNGQILPINSNTALYSLLGTTYGGNGTNTFALPNLQNNLPTGAAAGPALTPRSLGETGGKNNYTLKKVPPHNHPFYGTTETNNDSSPGGNYNGLFTGLHDEGIKRYATPSDAKTTTGKLDPATIGPAGAATPLPVSNVQPYLNVSFIICLAGNFPPRP